MAENRLNILVLVGGDSPERDVSLDSGKAIVDALKQVGHQAETHDPIDPGTHQPSEKILNLKPGDYDLLFFGLHGGSGENGLLQGLLELKQIPYTGSSMAASAVAMNKDMSKRLMTQSDIPTAAWIKLEKAKGSLDNRPSLPVIVKPNNGGSTVGLTLVEKEDDLLDAIDLAFQNCPEVLIERYHSGREITISILNGQPLPPVEIIPKHKLYDYTCKYTEGASEYICPAEIDPAVADKLSSDAVKLYNLLGCRHYARIDFILQPDNNYICLELNSLPGMTALSLFPLAASAISLDFPHLCDKISRMALEGGR